MRKENKNEGRRNRGMNEMKKKRSEIEENNKETITRKETYTGAENRKEEKENTG